MRISIFTSLFFLFHALPVSSQNCNLHPPKNLFATNITSCSAVLHWSPYAGASEYKVRFKPETATDWSPTVSVGLDTSYLFIGLEANTSYNLAVRSFCSDGSKSDLIRITIKTKTCTLPSNTSVQPVNGNTSKITITTLCPVDTIYYRYALPGQPLITHFTLDPNSIYLTGLVDGSRYRYQVSTCPLALNSWTPVNSFIFHPPKPNVLLILLDDSRFDFYSCNGAPSFFQTPNIDRIANEGVNFKDNFAVYSLCAPSRSSIVTGLYSSSTNVISNTTSPNLNPALPTLFSILHLNGYYTALLGKNQDMFKYDPANFDYFFTCLSLSDEDSPKVYSYFGDTTDKAGYIIDVLTDSVVNVIQNTTEPFFIWLGYLATHTPLVPKPQYDGLYDDEPMPVGPDTAAYTTNYPSFLYSLAPRNYAVDDEVTDLYSDTYEVMKDVDDHVGHILLTLQNTGKLDNTVVIFTSDNGHLFGEHHMNMKRLAYDPSIRTPLFIRYPNWFPATSQVSDEITLNIDLAPTILQATGVTNSYNLDGKSLFDIYTNLESRQEMYYHSFYTTENKYQNLPYAKAIRDFQYKYIYYGCSNNVTQELFDLRNDPMEMVNLVQDPLYNSTVEGYRDKIAFYSILYHDTTSEVILNCNLTSGKEQSSQVEYGSEHYDLYPNPSNDYVNFSTSASTFSHIQIMDLAGKIVFESGIMPAEQTFRLPSLPPGCYTIIFYEGDRKIIRKLIIQ